METQGQFCEFKENPKVDKSQRTAAAQKWRKNAKPLGLSKHGGK